MKSQLDEKDEYIQKCEADLEALGEYKAQIFEVIPGGKPIDIEKLQAKVEWLENELEGREEQLRAIQESVKEAIDPT
jgi:predicted ATP-grasp superfamily ATP-dependent carboligase